MEDGIKIVIAIVVAIIIALSLTVVVTNRVNDTDTKSGNIADTSQDIINDQTCKLKCDSCTAIGKTAAECSTDGCTCT